jgi:small subunit ribosomal protein S11e
MLPVSFDRAREYSESNFLSLFACSDVELGDVVTVGECRPLSKTVKFNVLKVAKVGGAKKKFNKF